MNWELVLLGGLTAAGFVGKIVRTFPREDDRIRDHLKILNALPENSTARTPLLAHIDALVVKWIKAEKEERRDSTGIGLGLVLIAGGLLSLYYGFEVSGLAKVTLWVLAGLLLLIGVPGLAQSLPRRERDERGNPIK